MTSEEATHAGLFSFKGPTNSGLIMRLRVRVVADMQASLRWMVTLLATVTISGCGALKNAVYADYSVRPLTVTADIEVSQILAAIQAPVKLGTADGGAETNRPNPFSEENCSNPGAKSEEAQCEAARNRTLARLTAASDELCSAHLRTIYGNDASSNVVLGSLATVFTTVAASVGSVAAKTNFATAGAIASAERSLINDVVYKSVLAPAIHQKILDERAKRRVELNAVYSTPYVHYPIERAVAEVVNYHHTCSFMLGLQLALKEGNSNTQLAELRAQVADAEAKLRAASANKLTTSGDDPIYAQALERFKKLSNAQLQLETTMARLPVVPMTTDKVKEPPPSTLPAGQPISPSAPASAPAPAASSPTPPETEVKK